MGNCPPSYIRRKGGGAAGPYCLLRRRGGAGAAAVTSSGPLPPTAAVNSGAGTSWTNPTNALTSNDSYATAAHIGLDTSRNLQLTGFGFAIPGGATILGIAATVERKSNQSGQTTTSAVQLLKAGVAAGSAKGPGSTWTTSDAAETWGTNSDLWGTTWTPAEVNAADFGVQLKTVDGGGAATASVDVVTLTVYYQ